MSWRLNRQYFLSLGRELAKKGMLGTAEDVYLSSLKCRLANPFQLVGKGAKCRWKRETELPR